MMTKYCKILNCLLSKRGNNVKKQYVSGKVTLNL